MEPAELTLWSNLVLPLVLNQEPPPAVLPGGGLALLSADTDRTQEFVFQSARLPEIRGASMRLDELNRIGLRRILMDAGLPARLITADPPGCLIYVGGGSLLALVPRDLAASLAAAIEALYPRKTDVATITAVVQPITLNEARGLLHPALQPTRLQALAATLSPADRQRLDNSLTLKPIPRLMRQQALRLRWRKQAKPAAPIIEANPFARICPSCGRRPAGRLLSGIPDEAPRYLCEICYANDRYGRDPNNKSVWHKAFEEWAAAKHGVTLTATSPPDLRAIGQASNGYIGFIYADGNRIGRLLETADDFPSYSQLSQALEKATTTAVYSALYAHLYQNQRLLPFEIITIGGDDVLLIVPAHTALPVARDICAHFTSGMQTAVKEEDAPTMSAGVVIAQDSNPIYFLHDLARQLLHSAKKRSKEMGVASLDFMTLKSQSTLATDLQAIRRSPYLQVEQEQNYERCLLTGRPYTLPELDRLLDGAHKLKQIGFAPGQLHQMRREFQNGRFPAIFYYLYQRQRLTSQNPRFGRLLYDIEVAWGMVEKDDDRQGAPPWIPLGMADDGYAEFSTPWLDMLTLQDFVLVADHAPDNEGESDAHQH